MIWWILIVLHNGTWEPAVAPRVQTLEQCGQLFVAAHQRHPELHYGCRAETEKR